MSKENFGIGDLPGYVFKEAVTLLADAWGYDRTMAAISICCHNIVNNSVLMVKNDNPEEQEKASKFVTHTAVLSILLTVLPLTMSGKQLGPYSVKACDFLIRELRKVGDGSMSEDLKKELAELETLQ